MARPLTAALCQSSGGSAACSGGGGSGRPNAIRALGVGDAAHTAAAAASPPDAAPPTSEAARVDHPGGTAGAPSGRTDCRVGHVRSRRASRWTGRPSRRRHLDDFPS